MLSNKLTFSLTSLVFLLMFAFVATSVMAAEGGPTVTITDAGTATAPSERGAFILKIALTEPVGDPSTAADKEVTYQFYDKDDVGLGADPIDANLVTNDRSTDNKSYSKTINLTTGLGTLTPAVAATAVGFHVSVPEDAFTSTLVGGKGNVENSMRFSLPPELLDQKVVITAELDDTDTDPTDGQNYKLTFTFTDADADPGLTDAKVKVEPSYIDAAPTLNAAPTAVNADGDWVFTGSITHPAGAPDLTVTLEESYVAAKDVTSETIPPVIKVNPAVAINIVDDSHDPEARTFKVEVTFTGADPIIKDFDLENLVATDKNMATVELSHVTPKAERMPTDASQTYVAIVQYDRLADPPLTLTTSEAYSKKITNTAPPTTMVGMGPPTPDTTDPVVAITAPPTAAQSAAVTLAFRVTEVNPATGMPTVTGSPTPAAGNYMISAVAAGATTDTYMVTITPLAATATTGDIAETAVTLTVTGSDMSGNTGTATATVTLAARTAPAVVTQNNPAFAAGTSITAVSATAGTAIASVTLPAATDADATDTTTYTITPTLPAGLTFTAATRMLSGTPTAAMAATMYTYTATSSDAAETAATLTFTITVATTSGETPVPVVIGGTMNPVAAGAAGAITFMLDAAALQAGDYIILQPATALNDIKLAAANVSTTVVPDALWTDLEGFFRFGGGAIDLVGPTGSLDKDVVISEIMWAADATPLPGIVQTQSQWIELYVAADSTQVSKDSVVVANAKPGMWTLNMTSGNPGDKAANTTDRMSNWGLGQWNVTSGSYGQNGSLGNLAGNGIPASSPIAFVSMYRNINHKDRVKTDKNRADQLNAIPDGTRNGSWKEDEANRGRYQTGNRYATPGQDQIINIISADAADTVARDGVIFNEIANRSAAKHEWIELHNQKTGSVDIKKYVLSMVSAELVATDDTDAHAKKDVAIVTFADADEDIVIPGGGYLVIVNTDPADTSLAVGQNVADPNSSKQGVDTLYYVDADLELPDTGKFFLILRTEVKAGSHEKIVDVAAGNGGYFGLVDDDPNYNTDAWPLRSVGAGAKDDLGMNDDKTWRLDTAKALFHGDSWVGDAGVTGLGVDRNKTTFNSGTPGYANDAVQAEYFDADSKAKFTGMISISEVMVDQTRRNLPQWIEIYNASRTQAININGWELKILNVNSADLDGRTSTTLKIDGDLIVAPNQTALIVSGSGRRSSDIPDTSVYNLYAKHRQKLEMNSQRDSILSIEGFYISLSDARDVVADSVGNIDSNAKTDDAPAWALPMSDDGRSSLLRRYTSSDADDGTTAAGWILASMTNLVPQTYYGDTDDIASPGHRQGSPLPVSLSSFRPLRDQATGDVVIRWITQSELNNAGFNILRSETKKGEYKVVNLKGIVAGHGTTSEQHVYEWKDTTAKPNVVYYYQIEDVSLDGKRTALATTRLKGHVSAAGKVTTTWGDLKNQ